MLDDIAQSVAEGAFELTDEDVDNLPFFLRWPVQFVLSTFLGVVANAFWWWLATAIGALVHNWLIGAQPPMFYDPKLALRDDLAIHFQPYLVEAGIAFGGWLVLNAVLQLFLRHNLFTRVGTGIGAALAALVFGAWYGYALVLTGIAALL